MLPRGEHVAVVAVVKRCGVFNCIRHYVVFKGSASAVSQAHHRVSRGHHALSEVIKFARIRPHEAWGGAPKGDTGCVRPSCANGKRRRQEQQRISTWAVEEPAWHVPLSSCPGWDAQFKAGMQHDLSGEPSGPMVSARGATKGGRM